MLRLSSYKADLQKLGRNKERTPIMHKKCMVGRLPPSESMGVTERQPELSEETGQKQAHVSWVKERKQIRPPNGGVGEALRHDPRLPANTAATLPEHECFDDSLKRVTTHRTIVAKSDRTDIGFH